MDTAYLRLLSGSRCRIGYIPSESDLKRRYFAGAQLTYKKLGIQKLLYFDLGEEYEIEALPELLDCDAIHLSGGDPVKFLSQVRHRNFGEILRRYLAKGGILVGVSAGAMILSKTLDLLSAIDGQKRGKKSASALKFFDFEFYPHFRDDNLTKQKLADYAATHKTDVYACNDDSGILVRDGVIELLGNVTKFSHNATTVGASARRSTLN